MVSVDLWSKLIFLGSSFSVMPGTVTGVIHSLISVSRTTNTRPAYEVISDPEGLA